MIYIQKQRTPEAVKKKATELTLAPENHYKQIVLPQDTKKLRVLFEQMPKAEISHALCREQHGLCAYCMSRISADEHASMRIEHYQALSRNKSLALDYTNFLGVCHGGGNEKTAKPRVLCCDAARGEKELVINPWNRRQMDAVAYRRNGQIFIRNDVGLDPQLVNDMQNDLDNILVLNGIKDDKGNVKHDTSTRLVAKRRSTYDSIARQFERWDSKGCLTADYLQEQISQLEGQLKGEAEAIEFIGVRLYFLREKYKKLKRLKLRPASTGSAQKRA